MKKNFLSFFSFLKKKKSKDQKKEESPTEVKTSLQSGMSQKDGVTQKLLEEHVFDVHTPMYLRVITALAIGLGSDSYNLKFTTDRRLEVWFLSVRVSLSVSKYYYINIVLYPSLPEGKVITMNNSNQRDIKISEDYLLKEFNSLVQEISEAYQTRLKGYRAEKRFKQLLEAYLKDSGKKDYVISYSDIADRQGVDISVEDSKKKLRNFYFQVKSSQVRVETKFYRDEMIHKIVVNDSVSDKDIRDQIKKIMSPS
jgi:hypothetical protein